MLVEIRASTHAGAAGHHAGRYQPACGVDGAAGNRCVAHRLRSGGRHRANAESVRHRFAGASGPSDTHARALGQPFPELLGVLGEKSPSLAGAGRVLARFPATMGSEHDPLPIGTWKVNGVSKDPPFFYNPDLFWDAKELSRMVSPGIPAVLR